MSCFTRGEQILSRAHFDHFVYVDLVFRRIQDLYNFPFFRRIGVRQVEDDRDGSHFLVAGYEDADFGLTDIAWVGLGHDCNFTRV